MAWSIWAHVSVCVAGNEARPTERHIATQPSERTSRKLLRFFRRVFISIVKNNWTLILLNDVISKMLSRRCKGVRTCFGNKIHTLSISYCLLGPVISCVCCGVVRREPRQHQASLWAPKRAPCRRFLHESCPKPSYQHSILPTREVYNVSRIHYFKFSRGHYINNIASTSQNQEKLIAWVQSLPVNSRWNALKALEFVLMLSIWNRQ